MDNKASMSMKIIVFMILGLIVVIFTVSVLTERFNLAGKTIDENQPNSLDLKIRSCKLQGLRGFQDSDRDQYPDFCDVCEGSTDDKHSDNDWLPDGCDANPTKTGTVVEECNNKEGYEWNKKREACLIKTS